MIAQLSIDELCKKLPPNVLQMKFSAFEQQTHCATLQSQLSANFPLVDPFNLLV